MWNFMRIRIIRLSKSFVCDNLWATLSLKWINLHCWMSCSSIWLGLLNGMSWIYLLNGIVLCRLLSRVRRLQYLGLLKMYHWIFEQWSLWNILFTLLWWCKYGLRFCMPWKLNNFIWPLSVGMSITLLRILRKLLSQLSLVNFLRF